MITEENQLHCMAIRVLARLLKLANWLNSSGSLVLGILFYLLLTLGVMIPSGHLVVLGLCGLLILALVMTRGSGSTTPFQEKD